jgi:hypothetical protein
MDATNNIANDLFYKIRSRFSGLKLGTAEGVITINPEEARFFDFDYKDDDVSIGHVSISLAEENSMKVYFSTGITESMDSRQRKGWYSFLRELRLFAKRRLMAFDTRDIAKDNLDKRDYKFLSQNSQSQDKSLTQTTVGENVMNESQMYGTKTVSYQKLLDTRLIIKHSKALVDDQQPGARARNISALFVENQEGERFKYPFIHLAGARAMQRHVANGGLPYDDLGQSIINMSEEIAQLKSFGNYVVRNDLMNSDTNDIVSKSQQRLEGLREQIARLSKQHHYEQYKADFQASSPIEIPQSMVEEFTEKFTVRNFKEDIKSVFPILYRLMQENSKVDYSDIVAMTTENINDTAEIDVEEEQDHLARFENWILDLGESSPIQSNEEQILAIKNLNKLTAQAFPAGADGINAIESLKGIIDDPKLYAEIKEAAKTDPQVDVRPMVKDWLDKSAPEIVAQIDFGDMADQPAEAEPAAPAAAPAAPEAGSEAAASDDAEAAAGDAAVAAATGETEEEGEQMVTQSDDPDERNKKNDKDDLPFDADDDVSDKDEFGNTIKHKARHLAKKGMRQAMNVKELAEFIQSFYDKETGTFPKGPEGVCTMVGKKFGEDAERVARKFVERMAPHQEQGAEELEELARIRELAGMRSLSREQATRESDVREDEDELEELRAELRDAYKRIYDSASQGNDETDHIADELGEFFDRVEELGDPDMQKGFEMLRSTVDTSPEEQAEAAQRAMVSLARSEPDIEIDRESIELNDIRKLSGIAQGLRY